MMYYNIITNLEDATYENIEKIIESLEKEFKVKRKNYPTRYISILN